MTQQAGPILVTGATGNTGRAMQKVSSGGCADRVIAAQVRSKGSG
jgi:hypothetical protein